MNNSLKNVIGIVLTIGILALTVWAWNNIKPVYENTQLELSDLFREPEPDTSDNITNFPYSLNDSTVSIFGLGGEGMDRCSGVIYKIENGKTYVLTAKHCIGTDEEVYIENMLVDLIYTSPTDDLAVFIVGNIIKNKVPIDMALVSPSKDEEIFHLGYPDGTPYKASGKFDRRTKDWGFAKMVVKKGCSGGPVVDIQGRLVGILWGMSPKDHSSILEPIEDIQKFLKIIEDNK